MPFIFNKKMKIQLCLKIFVFVCANFDVSTIIIYSSCFVCVPSQRFLFSCLLFLLFCLCGVYCFLVFILLLLLLLLFLFDFTVLCWCWSHLQVNYAVTLLMSLIVVWCDDRWQKEKSVRVHIASIFTMEFVHSWICFTSMCFFLCVSCFPLHHFALSLLFEIAKSFFFLNVLTKVSV